MENNKKYSRREFLTTVGGISLAAVLLKFFNAKDVIKVISAKNGGLQNAYGNNTYGGAKEA